MSWSHAARPFRLIVALAVVACLCPTAPAQVSYFDNFNDGNDTTPPPPWGHYQPLAPLGSPGTWSFPGGNTYRIQAAPTTNLATFGPGRSAAVRDTVSYTDFFVAADLVNWNNTVPQSFGLAARLRELGLGTTDGYLFLFDTAATNNFNIYRANNENVAASGGGATLASGSLTLTPGTSYVFTFQGTGGNLTGQVFTAADPTTPLLIVSGSDATYPSGFSGLLVAEDTAGPIAGADATFDNFFAGPVAPVPEPGTWALTTLAAAGMWGWRRSRK